MFNHEITDQDRASELNKSRMSKKRSDMLSKNKKQGPQIVPKLRQTNKEKYVKQLLSMAQTRVLIQIAHLTTNLIINALTGVYATFM